MPVKSGWQIPSSRSTKLNVIFVASKTPFFPHSANWAAGDVIPLRDKCKTLSRAHIKQHIINRYSLSWCWFVSFNVFCWTFHNFRLNILCSENNRQQDSDILLWLIRATRLLFDRILIPIEWKIKMTFSINFFDSTIYELKLWLALKKFLCRKKM